MKRARRLGCRLLPIAVVFACGASDSAAPASSAAEATAPGAQAPPAQCGRFDAAQAAAVLGVPIDAIRAAHQARTALCRFEIDRGHAVVFMRHIAASTETAEAALIKASRSYGAYARCAPIPAVGDAALYCERAPEAGAAPGGEAEGRLLARRGAVWLDVVSPVNRPLQLQVARTALEDSPR